VRRFIHNSKYCLKYNKTFRKGPISGFSRKEEDRIVVVKDTGVGIPKEMLS
jgi:signal transduction histidine kinase